MTTVSEWMYREHGGSIIYCSVYSDFVAICLVAVAYISYLVLLVSQ